MHGINHEASTLIGGASFRDPPSYLEKIQVFSRWKGQLDMLFIIIDMAIVWFLLNLFSDENWDDQKLKIFGIVLAISILGGLAASAVAPTIGAFPALAAYFVIGTLCLWGLASLQLKKAMAAMGIFTGIKLAMAIVVIFFMSS